MTFDHFSGIKLPLLLDELWRNPRDRSALARKLLAKLSMTDWLILAGWDTAATFGPQLGGLSLMKPGSILITDGQGESFLMALLADTNDYTDLACLIAYQEVCLKVFLDVSSPYTPSGSFMHDPIALLAALQFVRDYDNSSLPIGKEMRDAKIAQLATDIGLTKDHFYRLSIWFPKIEHLLRD